MPALSFSVFRDKILDGSKRQTIRGIRKRAIAEGDKLFLYWKQQSPKHCEKLGEATCVKAREISICTDAYDFPDDQYSLVDHPSHLNDFAIADGFDNWQQLIEFLENTHGLPFTGVLIEWDGIVRDVDPKLVEALND